MARKQGHNKVAYEERLRDAVNVALRQTLKDPRLMLVTATRAELTADYSHAKIYWDTFDVENRGKIKEAVDGISSKLRAVLAKEMDMRHTPSISFIYDSQFEDEKTIVDLLNSTKNNGQES